MKIPETILTHEPTWGMRAGGALWQCRKIPGYRKGAAQRGQNLRRAPAGPLPALPPGGAGGREFPRRAPPGGWGAAELPGEVVGKWWECWGLSLYLGQLNLTK